MRVKIFNSLPHEAMEIRRRVFVDEQGFVNEFDSADDNATHIVIYNEEKAVATCRFYFDKALASVLIGRVAVSAECRKSGIGAELIRCAEAEIKKGPHRRAVIHAQTRASGFYKKCGYTVFGDADLEEGCPHVWMEKNL